MMGSKPIARNRSAVSRERVRAATLLPDSSHARATRSPKYPQPMIKFRFIGSGSLRAYSSESKLRLNGS